MNQQSPPKKLIRSRSDRYIGGVAAGLARYLNVDPVFVRIAFLISLAFGGAGLIVYVVLLAIAPIEGDPAEPLPAIEPKRRNQMIGLSVIVGIVALATADSGGFAAWIFGFWPGTVFGVLFWVAIGAGLSWLLASGLFNPGADRSSAPSPAAPTESPQPPAPAASAEPARSSEVVTYAASPSQLSTEVMETRQMESETTEPDPVAPVRDDGPSTIGRIMLWFAIGFSALIVFCLLFVLSAGTTVLFGGVPMAALVIALGAGMVFAGLRGRRQLSLWLLTAAIAVTIPMAVVSIADLRVDGSYGDIDETPLSMVNVPDDGYKMAAGNMTIDLRKFDFGDRRELDLPVRSGMGLTSIVVPDDVCVTGTVQGKAGVLNIRGHQWNGVDISESASSDELTGRASRRHVVRLDGEFKLGAFEVVDNTQWRRNGRGQFDESNGSGNLTARERATAACSVKPGPNRQNGKKRS